MPFLPRLRWPGIRKAGTAALTVALLLIVAGCVQPPNSVFHNRTEFNRDSNSLFVMIIWVGGFVFVFVEALLIGVMIKYRARPGQREPEHVHGNTTLEIAWTAIPALILMFIAVPTVRTIFRTQAKAKSDALQVTVVGHQWWWEFRYPEYTSTEPNGKIDTLVTANELYLPLGRTVNFTLKSADVIHSFWIPAMGGKRDLIANRTNYLWFTPDSASVNAWNGVCVEYCGTNHAYMRFRAYTVTPADFESWAAHQKLPATLLNAPPPVAPGAPAAGATAAAKPAAATGAAAVPGATGVPAAATPAAATTSASVVQTGYISFPKNMMPEYSVPNTPIPAGITVDESIQGDAARGEALFKAQGAGTPACWTCHTINGLGAKGANTAPNLTHVASRNTFAAGLYPNDTKHLLSWVTNAPAMKHGIAMPTFGKSQIWAETHQPGMLDGQQVADIVAYLQTLK